MIDPQRIWNSQHLPTLPAVAIRLLDLTRDPDTGIDAVVGVIRSDPAISAKIVKAANSTFFGFRAEVKSIDRAVPLLGTTVATSLALSFSLSDGALQRGPLADQYRAYWMNSIVSANAAETLCQMLHPNQTSEYFLGGLLLDLGRLAILKCAPDEYHAALETTSQEGRPLHEVEREILGFDHTEIGYRLMQNWRLPDVMIEATRRHHAAVEDLTTPQQGVPEFAMHLAIAATVGDYFCTELKGPSLDRLRKLTGRILNFSESDLEQYLVKCDERLQIAADIFSIDVSGIGHAADVMVQANEQLMHLTMREHAASTQASLRQQQIELEKQRLETRNQELQEQALLDSLTRIYNRKFFDDALEREIGRCRRHALPIAALFIDLDHFKQVNDVHGHQVGDLVLRETAALFKGCLRSSDVLARYGGEEFVVLINQPTEKGVEKLAERIRQKLAEHVITTEETSFRATCSIGGAIAIPGRRDTEISTRLMTTADEALYAAKRSGRNRTEIRSLVSEQHRLMLQEITSHRFSRWLVNQKLLDIATVSQALVECPPNTARLGELAQNANYLTFDDVNTILGEQEDTGERFGEVAQRLGLLTHAQVVHLLTQQQESPKQLASVLIRLGHLAPQVAVKALEDYLRTQTPVAREAVLV